MSKDQGKFTQPKRTIANFKPNNVFNSDPDTNRVQRDFKPNILPDYDTHDFKPEPNPTPPPKPQENQPKDK